MKSKIVPVYSRIIWRQGKRCEEGQVLLYDIYVDGRWVGSRNRAQDAEAALLQYNPPIQTRDSVVG